MAAGCAQGAPRPAKSDCALTARTALVAGAVGALALTGIGPAAAETEVAEPATFTSAFTAMAVVLMGGWAYFRTPNIKIGGRILTADPSHRGADPLP